MQSARRRLVPKRVAVARALEAIVQANGGDYAYVRDNFLEALDHAMPKQTTKEVFEPAARSPGQ